MAETDENLSHSWYWDERYSQPTEGDAPTHEWFRSFTDLEPFFQKFLLESPGRRASDNPLILHLGSGDSVIPAEFDSRGYTRQLCVDFSPRVVKMMTERHKSRPGIEWREIDVRDMVGIADKSVDIAFDKGTMDAMIHGSPWSPPDEVKDNTGRYLREIHRVLKDDGIFLYVTFRQPHFMRPLLDIGGLWVLDMDILSSKGSFDYYGWVIRKAGPVEEKLEAEEKTENNSGDAHAKTIVEENLEGKSQAERLVDGYPEENPEATSGDAHGKTSVEDNSDQSPREDKLTDGTKSEVILRDKKSEQPLPRIEKLDLGTREEQVESA